jgi:hypothetical protein
MHPTVQVDVQPSELVENRRSRTVLFDSGLANTLLAPSDDQKARDQSVRDPGNAGIAEGQSI